MMGHMARTEAGIMMDSIKGIMDGYDPEDADSFKASYTLLFVNIGVSCRKDEKIRKTVRALLDMADKE